MAQDACPPGNGPAGLVVPQAGKVVETRDASLPWQVLDDTGLPIAPVSEFLRELVAHGNTAASCRSYAYDLLRWFRFLAAVEVPWNRAQRTEVWDFVLRLRASHNPARDRHREGGAGSGIGKPAHRQAVPARRYAPATINHALSVISAFYDHHVQAGHGPVVSPVPPQSRHGRRIEAHHNPLEPFRLHRRGAYRQKHGDPEPRTVPDGVIEDLFAALGCNRDRALFSMFLSSGRGPRRCWG